MYFDACFILHKTLTEGSRLELIGFASPFQASYLAKVLEVFTVAVYILK